MRDLYQLIGCPRDAALGTLRWTISSLPGGELKRDAEAVLLDPERRLVYDGVLRAYLVVLEVRDRLGAAGDDATWRRAGGPSNSPAGSAKRMAAETREDVRAAVAGLRAVARESAAGPQDGASHGTTADTKSVAWSWIVAAALLFAMQVYCVTRPDDNARHSSPRSLGGRVPSPKREAVVPSATSTPPRVSTPVQEPPALPLPFTGTIYQSPMRGDLGPFEIKTRHGGPHMYIKVVDVVSNEVAVRAFIRSGETLRLDLQVGEYELRYASGYGWRGERLCFGRETRYARADEIFEIRVNYLRRAVEGFVVELYERVGGNLDTDLIEASDF